jgi:hypothetical protein
MLMNGTGVGYSFFIYKKENRILTGSYWKFIHDLDQEGLSNQVCFANFNVYYTRKNFFWVYSSNETQTYFR